MDFLDKLMNRFGSKSAEKNFYNKKVEVNYGGTNYLDTDVPYELYNSISELNQVINRKAEMLSGGYFNVLNGTDKIEHEILSVLKNPNPLMSENEFIKTICIHLSVYGNCFIYKNKPSRLSKVPSTLDIISPEFISPIFFERKFNQVNLNGIVKEYQYDNGNLKRTFLENEIIWIKNFDINEQMIGVSPIKSLKYPLSNIKGAYDYLNVISTDKGALGALSFTTKDGDGGVPLDPKEKLKYENTYRSDYGVGSDKAKRIIITDSNVNWTPMSYPTRDLLLLEQIENNKLLIIDHFGLDANIFSAGKSTYENVKNGFIQTYSNTIFPYSQWICQKLQQGLQLESDLELTLDYSHLQLLQDAETQKAMALKTKLDSVVSAVQSGIISNVEARNILSSFGVNI